VSKTFDRISCVVCNSEIEHILTFENFPIYMGTNTEKQNEVSNMKWSSCINCGCVQLQQLIKPEILYKEPHNPSIGKVWENHNNEFSDLISQYEHQRILEIGGANLKMANLISKKANFVCYDVIDYSSNEYSTIKINDKINLVKSSAENYAINNKVDCIILSHTFEHIYEPVEMLSKLSQCLEENGHIFISVPNIKNQLIDGFLNALNFEHTFFIDDEYLVLIANNAGFYIENIQQFSKYNSFYVLKKTKHNVSTNKHSNPKNAKTIFLSFTDNLSKDVQQIKQELGTNKAYVFGAHVFSQFLLNFGLNEENIIYILDNDISKNEKYLFGTSLFVKNPKVLLDIQNPYVIVRTAQYKEEIVSQLNSLNPNIRYI